MSDKTTGRFCGQCGILDELQRPTVCPQCSEEVLDMESGPDENFFYQIFKQHRMYRWLRGFCFGLLFATAVWGALLYFLHRTNPFEGTDLEEVVLVVMLSFGQWLVLAGAALFGWGYSRWKRASQPAPVQQLETLLLRRH